MKTKDYLPVIGGDIFNYHQLRIKLSDQELDQQGITHTSRIEPTFSRIEKVQISVDGTTLYSSLLYWRSCV